MDFEKLEEKLEYEFNQMKTRAINDLVIIEDIVHHEFNGTNFKKTNLMLFWIEKQRYYGILKSKINNKKNVLYEKIYTDIVNNIQYEMTKYNSSDYRIDKMVKANPSYIEIDNIFNYVLFSKDYVDIIIKTLQSQQFEISNKLKHAKDFL